MICGKKECVRKPTLKYVSSGFCFEHQNEMLKGMHRVMPGDFGSGAFQKEAAETFTRISQEWFECDTCGKEEPPERKHVVRVPRPSNPSDWSAILWVCGVCGPEIGAKTEDEWDEWMQTSEAAEQGALFLS